MPQEEVTDDIDTTEGQLLSANNEGDIITANGEIVGELVMDDGDPSVIVESIVNADGSVFVDERDFNNYCNNHLGHDSHFPGLQGILFTLISISFFLQLLNLICLFFIYVVSDMETISTPVEIEKLTKSSTTLDPPPTNDPLSSASTPKSPIIEEVQDPKIWIVRPAANIENEADSCAEAELPKTPKIGATDVTHDVNNVDGFTNETNHQLLLEQMVVFRAKKGKIFYETEMLKLKKDKLKLQINCYANEIKKQDIIDNYS